MPSQESSGSPSGLTPAQLAELRTSLLHARAETAALLKDEEATARFAEGLAEPMDAAELSREQGDATLLLERARVLLRDIDAALARMEAGQYGVSERSGDPIGFPRLKALPWARFTADEQ